MVKLNKRMHVKLLILNLYIALACLPSISPCAESAIHFYPNAKGQFDILVKKYGPINICLFGLKGERAASLKGFRLQH